MFRVSQFGDSTIYRVRDGIYMTSNETRHFRVGPTKLPGACHVGCSGWENFDLMVLRRSEYGIIFDFNPDNKIFIEITLEVVRTSPTRREFVKTFSGWLRKTNVIFSSKTPDIVARLGFDIPAPIFTEAGVTVPVEEFRWCIRRPHCWLGTEARYQFIRDLAMKGNIQTITQDISNTAVFADLVAYLESSQIAIDTVYVSNIPAFSFGKRRPYINTLLALVSPKTVTIHCPPVKDNPNPLDQRKEHGRSFIYEKPLVLLARTPTPNLHRHLTAYSDALGVSALVLRRIYDSPVYRGELRKRLRLAYNLAKPESREDNVLSSVVDSEKFRTQLSEVLDVYTSEPTTRVTGALVDLLRF